MNIEDRKSKNTPSQFIWTQNAVQLCILRFMAQLCMMAKMWLLMTTSLPQLSSGLSFTNWITTVRPRSTLTSNQIVLSSKQLRIPLRDFTKFSNVKMLEGILIPYLLYFFYVVFLHISVNIFATLDLSNFLKGNW